MKDYFIKALSSVSVLFGFFILNSCTKNNTDYNMENQNQLEVTISSENRLNTEIVHSEFSEKKLLVLLANGFNSPEAVSKLNNYLDDNFGINQPNSLIQTLVYPDDFKRGSRSYASEFFSILNDTEKDYSGVLLLGAPENTHKSLAHNQDFWDLQVTYPIVALFPQDDTLGMESTCDFIIDQKNKTADKNTENNSQIKLDETNLNLIYKTISYMLKSEIPFEKNAKLSIHIEEMLNSKDFHHFADPDTGLLAINHFVIEN